MSSYDELERDLGQVNRLLKKFESDPTPVEAFLGQEEVPSGLEEHLREQLNQFCVRKRLGHFLDLREKKDRTAYIAFLCDEFESNPRRSLHQFLVIHRVPETVRAEVEKRLKTILLLRGAARTLRKRAGLTT